MKDCTIYEPGTGSALACQLHNEQMIYNWIVGIALVIISLWVFLTSQVLEKLDK